MKYRLIDHTADIGIQVFGADLTELFENAARGMFEIMTDIDTLKGKTHQAVDIEGDDWPDLMVNWLRELLYLWTGGVMLVKCADIQSISEYKLSAKVTVDPYDPERHVIKEEIKAVTYHQIDVHKGSTSWKSKIIFDV